MTVTAAPILRYGGFWSRVVASVIDGFVLSMVCGAVSAATGRDLFNTDVEHFDWLAYCASLAIGWLYEASLTASPRGATLGKMAIGLRVVDAAGRPISFLRASTWAFSRMARRLFKRNRPVLRWSDTSSSRPVPMSKSIASMRARVPAMLRFAL